MKRYLISSSGKATISLCPGYRKQNSSRQNLNMKGTRCADITWSSIKLFVVLFGGGGRRPVGSEGVPNKSIQPPMTGRLFIENVPKVVTCKNIFELFRTLRDVS